MYDLAIVGGGPVGSRLAYQIARYGHRVAVFETKKATGPSACCTGIIGQECVRTFAVPDEVILRQVSQARLVSPGGRELNISREQPQAAVLDRAAFDHSLAQQAEETGAEYHYASPVTGLETNASGVTLTVRQAGEKNLFRARAVALATGFKQQLIARAGLARPRPFLVGAQTDVAIPELKVMELYFGEEVAPGFFAWLVPTTDGRARLGLLSRRRPGYYLKKLLTTLKEQGRITEAAGRVCYQGVPMQPLPHTSRDRLLVVGTAAGQVKPTTGGGIYYGLLGADIAAATLHRALAANNLSAHQLARYDRQWQRRLAGEIKKGGRVRNIYNHLSDQEIDLIFEKLARGGRLGGFLNDSSVAFDWHSGGLMRLLGTLAVTRMSRFRNLFRKSS